MKFLIILKNHIRIFKNWILFRENLIFVMFILFILIFLLFSIRSKLLQIEKNILLIILFGFFIIIISISLTNLYLKLCRKENNLLLTLITKTELLKVRLTQTIITNLSVFIGTFIFLFYSLLDGIVGVVYLISGILFLLFFSFIQSYLIIKFQINSSRIKSTKLWNISISNHKASPTRGY